MKEDYRFECTCGACPEQYDIFRKSDNKYVGYIRCRWGCCVVLPVVDDKIQWSKPIYTEYYENGFQGVIEDRDKVFDAAGKLLDDYFNEN